MTPGLYRISLDSNRSGLTLYPNTSHRDIARFFESGAPLMVITALWLAKTSSESYYSIAVLCADGVVCVGTIAASSLEPFPVDSP